jgi:hypothetical protein
VVSLQERAMAYRRCEICKQLIDAERAECRPMTRLCIKHAQEIEKYGGEFKLAIVEERISKHGSLKKNYGGVMIYQHRNHRAIRKLRDAYASCKAG